MTNIHAAAEIIADAFRPGFGGAAPAIGRDLAHLLADAGLLMPDMPEPVENESNGNPSWFNGWVEQDWGEVELHHNGSANGEGETTFTPEEARGLACALLAAANHAEGERDAVD